MLKIAACSTAHLGARQVRRRDRIDLVDTGGAGDVVALLEEFVEDDLDQLDEVLQVFTALGLGVDEVALLQLIHVSDLCAAGRNGTCGVMIN